MSFYRTVNAKVWFVTIKLESNFKTEVYVVCNMLHQDKILLHLLKIIFTLIHLESCLWYPAKWKENATQMVWSFNFIFIPKLIKSNVSKLFIEKSRVMVGRLIPDVCFFEQRLRLTANFVFRSQQANVQLCTNSALEWTSWNSQNEDYVTSRLFILSIQVTLDSICLET